MLNIEKLIIETNLNPEVRKELLDTVQDIASKKATNSPNKFIVDIARNFASKHSTLIESTGIIPQVLMQKNFKTIDFLIDTYIYGIYFALALFICFGWAIPIIFTFVGFSGIGSPHPKTYLLFLVMLGQLAYYRFLWKRLMP